MVRKKESKTSKRSEAKKEKRPESTRKRAARTPKVEEPTREPVLIVPSASQLSSVLSGLSLGVCIFTKDDLVEYFNQPFSQMTGLSESAVGKKLKKNALWGDKGPQDEFQGLLTQVRESKAPLILNSHPVGSEGREERRWNITLLPQYDQENEYEGMGLVIEDVTDLGPTISNIELLSTVCKASLSHSGTQALLEDVVHVLKDFSRCSSVKILIIDKVADTALKAETGMGPGLWDMDSPLTAASLDSIFADSKNEIGTRWTSGGSLYIDDISSAEEELTGDIKELVTNISNSYGLRALALIPLRLEDRITGFIQLGNKKEGGISGGVIETVETVSQQLRLALERVTLKDEIRKQRESLLKQMHERGANLGALGERLKQEVGERKRAQEEMRIERDLAIGLSGKDGLEDALELCLDTAMLVPGIDSGGIYIVDKDSGALILMCHKGLSPAFVTGATRYGPSSAKAQLVTNNQPVYINLKDATPPLDESYRLEGLTVAGIIPVAHGDQVIAAFNVASHQLEEFPADVRTFLETMAADIGSAIARISSRAELSESEERYSALFSRTASPIMVIDTDGHYIDANDAALAFLECTREELLSMNVKDTLPPYLDDQWFERYKAVWQSGGTVERDYYVWGKIKVMEMTITPLQFGELEIIIGIGKDITERKKAETTEHKSEDALRLSEEKYRSIVENASEGIFVVLDGKFKYANDRLLNFSQYSQEEIRGIMSERPFTELIYPDDRDMVLENYVNRTSGKDAPTQYEFRWLDKDGSVRWAEIRVSSLLWEGKSAALCFATDITAHKQADQAREESEQRYRVLADNALDVFWTTDMELAITYVSPSVRYFIGRSAEELMNMYRQNVLNAEIMGVLQADADRIEKGLRRLLVDPSRTQSVEFELRHPDGFTSWVEVKMSVMRDAKGRTAGILGVARDVTQQKKMLQRLVSADRLTSLGEMAAGLAHEVNNPLTAVMGFAYLLQQNPNTPPEIKNDVEAIYREGKRAAEVIKNFLIFARGQKPEKQTIYINDIVEGVLRLRRSQMEKENIEVSLNLGDDLPAIQGDISQLQQVFLNIILNAEYFMYKAHKRGQLTVVTEPREDMVKVTIMDDGPGIASDRLGRVFDPFYTTKDVGEGTGLGLSICYGIVREHGGSVYVESQPGKGAAFTVELPVGK
jgi:PAS domain S-box-containing protein